MKREQQRWIIEARDRYGWEDCCNGLSQEECSWESEGEAEEMITIMSKWQGWEDGEYRARAIWMEVE